MYNNDINFLSLIRQRPQAEAKVRGSNAFPDINGTVRFYQTTAGVVVAAQIAGLPTAPESCRERIFAFHIHSGGKCTGNEADYFADADGHYNPNGCPHPYHAGDMPPLFGCNGFAFSAFLTDRLAVREIIGKTVIIHSSPDDFSTQPAGNSGTKIACGVIQTYVF